MKTSAQLAQRLLAVASGGRSRPSLSFGSQPPIHACPSWWPWRPRQDSRFTFHGPSFPPTSDFRPLTSLRAVGSTEPEAGFTLLELLVVTGILVILMVLVIPALVALSASNGLSTGGRIVSNLLTIARSEAINRRSSIRFEVATTWPADSTQAYRKITLVQHDAVSGTDTQLTNWQTLPTGIALKDPSTNPPSGKYFLSVAQTQAPSLTLAGQTISTKYLEFTPNGAPNMDPASTPVRVRVVQGFTSGTSVIQAGSSNWYEVDVDGLVGKAQVTRP